MVIRKHSKEEVLQLLAEIPDPEIPVVNIKEMGMLYDVCITEAGYEILLMPTYTACPAMGIISDDIKHKLDANGIYPAIIKLVYSPAWSTDRLTKEARNKLLAYGIAPPLHSTCNMDNFKHNIIQCPLCRSEDTVLISRFGSTACKALYQCNDCHEPFEYFKCH